MSLIVIVFFFEVMEIFLRFNIQRDQRINSLFEVGNEKIFKGRRKSSEKLKIGKKLNEFVLNIFEVWKENLAGFS